MRPVYLVGMPGSGKSTVGRLLAERLGAEFLDLDEEIEASEGRAVEEIFAAGGEEAFRDRESAALMRTVGLTNAVVACGGGVVLRQANRRVLSAGRAVVWLRVPEEELARRVGDGEGRPLLAAGGDLAALAAAREGIYAQVATITVNGEADPATLAAAVAERLVG